MQDQFSAQDLVDLREIHNALPEGDPRRDKVRSLLGASGAPVQLSDMQAKIDALRKQNALNGGLDQKVAASVPGVRELTSNPQYRGALRSTLGEEVGGGLKDAAMGAYQMGKDVLSPPQNAAEILASLFPGGLESKRMLVDPQIALGQKAQRAQNPADAMKYSAEAAVPVMGPMMDSITSSDPLHATRTATSILAQLEAGKAVGAAAGKAGKMIAAEGDPNALYRRYLDPVANVPAAMPKTTPRLMSGLINKLEINYPEVAERIRKGSQTVGDLDTARQVANDASRAAFTARGLPTQISKGFKNVADALRDTVYPKIESLNNLPSGTLYGVKQVQGALIDMGKPPKWGYTPSRWLPVAVKRGVMRPMVRAFRNLQTRAIDSELP